MYKLLTYGKMTKSGAGTLRNKCHVILLINTTGSDPLGFKDIHMYWHEFKTLE